MSIKINYKTCSLTSVDGVILSINQQGEHVVDWNLLGEDGHYRIRLKSLNPQSEEFNIEYFKVYKDSKPLIINNITNIAEFFSVTVQKICTDNVDLSLAIVSPYDINQEKDNVLNIIL